MLNSGNLDVLYDFRDTHLNELNSPRYAPAKRYIDARIRTAEKLRTLEQKKKLAAFEGKVPPNTAVNMLRFEPFETEQLGTIQLTKAQKKAVSAEYIEQVKSSLQRTITEALTVHRCPVAVAWDGHFVTVTGISKDGKKLRYEESRGWETNAKRTRTMSLNELVSQAMFAHAFSLL